MSYAEASIRGAAEPDGENTVPIESVNITPEEVKSAIEHKLKSPESESSGEPSEKDKKDKKLTRKSIGSGDDPCASAGILMGVLAAVATTVGLVQKKRNNASITVEQGAMVGAGIVLITTGYYFYLTRGQHCKK